MIRHIIKNTIIYENKYYDDDLDREVWFGDIEDTNKPRYLYFLYYELAGYSFHSPIYDNPENPKDSIKELSKNLEIVRITDFKTYGQDVKDLLSAQFVKKLVEIIQSQDFVFIKP